MASNYIGWMDVIVGDPKTSLYEQEQSILPILLFIGLLGTILYLNKK